MILGDGWDEPTLDPRPGRIGRLMTRVRMAVAYVVRSLSPKARFALSLGLLATILLGIATFLLRPSATLTLVCRHDFRTADLTVSIDGEVVHTETITGAVVRKWLGAVERTQGTYTCTFPVSSGTHEVGIRLQAPGYDRTRSVQGEFIRGKESILSVDSGRGLSLAWRVAEHAGLAAEAPGASPGWMKHAGAILLTIFGSILSASVGVAVQEFLRSRARRGTVPPPSRPPS